MDSKCIFALMGGSTMVPTIQFLFLSVMNTYVILQNSKNFPLFYHFLDDITWAQVYNEQPTQSDRCKLSPELNKQNTKPLNFIMNM